MKRNLYVVAMVLATSLFAGRMTFAQSEEPNPAGDSQSSEQTNQDSSANSSSSGDTSSTQGNASGQANADSNDDSTNNSSSGQADSPASGQQTQSNDQQASANDQQNSANANADQPNESAGASESANTNNNSNTDVNSETDANASESNPKTDGNIQSNGVPAPAPSSANKRDDQSLLKGGNQQQSAARSRLDRDTNADRNRTNVNINSNTRQDELRRGIRFGRANDRGLVIDNLEQDSFYYRSGIRRNDVIISLYGRPVRSEADFLRYVVLKPGQRVPVVVWRDNRQQTIYVDYPTHVAHTENQVIEHRHANGGAYLGVMFDSRSRDGVVILSVNPGSPAQEAGLQAGDVILALNDQDVRAFQEAITIIRSLRPGDELRIVAERARNEEQFVAVLDSQPNQNTVAKPIDLEVNREGPANVEIEVEREPNRLLLDRDRNNDGSRDRAILPGRR